MEPDDAGSMLFWGPPGTGKTTLAKIIAAMSRAEFIEFSAVLSGIKEIKQDTKKDLVIETFKEIPEEDKKDYDPKKRNAFFEVGRSDVERTLRDTKGLGRDAGSRFVQGRHCNLEPFALAS